jgi:dihydrofolate reductase
MLGIEQGFKNKYTAIACVNKMNAIGRDGKLLYSIKPDLANFKSLTTGNVVIMGRKTFESMGRKPLKDRINIILTHQEDYGKDFKYVGVKKYENTFVCNSLLDADNLCYAYFSDKELFIIGGGYIFDEAFSRGIIDKAIITRVNDNKSGDVYFPKLKDHKIVFSTADMADEETGLEYRYIVYKK